MYLEHVGSKPLCPNEKGKLLCTSTNGPLPPYSEWICNGNNATLRRVTCAMQCAIHIQCGNTWTRACSNGCSGNSSISSYLEYDTPTQPFEISCRAGDEEYSLYINPTGITQSSSVSFAHMIFHHAMLHTKLVIISDTFFLISNGHNCVLFLVFDPSTPSYTIHPAKEKYERIVAFNWSEIDDIEQPVVYKLTFQMPDSSACGKITTETNVNFTVTANQTYSVRFLATTCGGAINSTSRLTINLTGMNIGYKIRQSIS